MSGGAANPSSAYDRAAALIPNGEYQDFRRVFTDVTDAERDDNHLLQLAAKHGRVSIAQDLLRSLAVKRGNLVTPLILAVQNGTENGIRIIKSLISRDVDVNGQRHAPLLAALFTPEIANRIDSLTLLLKQGARLPPTGVKDAFKALIASNSRQIINMLLPSLTPTDITPGLLDSLLKYFYAKKFYIDAGQLFRRSPDLIPRFGPPFLEGAIRADAPSAVAELLKSGVSGVEPGNAPVLVALTLKYIDVTRELVGVGADITGPAAVAAVARLSQTEREALLKTTKKCGACFDECHAHDVRECQAGHAICRGCYNDWRQSRGAAQTVACPQCRAAYPASPTTTETPAPVRTPLTQQQIREALTSAIAARDLATIEANVGLVENITRNNTFMKMAIESDDPEVVRLLIPEYKKVSDYPPLLAFARQATGSNAQAIYDLLVRAAVSAGIKEFPSDNGMRTAQVFRALTPAQIQELPGTRCQEAATVITSSLVRRMFSVATNHDQELIANDAARLACAAKTGPQSLLLMAVRDGINEIILEALNRGADVNFDNGNALVEAAKAGSLSTVRILLAVTWPIEAPLAAAIRQASANGRLNVMNYLIPAQNRVLGEVRERQVPTEGPRVRQPGVLPERVERQAAAEIRNVLAASSLNPTPPSAPIGAYPATTRLIRAVDNRDLSGVISALEAGADTRFNDADIRFNDDAAISRAIVLRADDILDRLIAEYLRYSETEILRQLANSAAGRYPESAFRIRRALENYAARPGATPTQHTLTSVQAGVNRELVAAVFAPGGNGQNITTALSHGADLNFDHNIAARVARVLDNWQAIRVLREAYIRRGDEVALREFAAFREEVAATDARVTLSSGLRVHLNRMLLQAIYDNNANNVREALNNGADPRTFADLAMRVAIILNRTMMIPLLTDYFRFGDRLPALVALAETMVSPETTTLIRQIRPL